MAGKTKIEWTDRTFNPWIGCTKVSKGCRHCYAETLSNRFGWTKWGPDGIRERTSPANWQKPVGWNDYAKRTGTRRRVFCASLADVFDVQAPEGAREDLFRLIKNTPYLVWQLLTKRPENMVSMLPDDWGTEGYPNVWLGITTEDQQTYDIRWPILSQTPVGTRFISYEPIVGSLSVKNHAEKPDWIIWGGESGAKARGCDVSWVENIVSECRALSISVFGKQWGTRKNNPLTEEYGKAMSEEMDPEINGKGGALLHGKLYREFPR